jgi:hypothetical protein
VVRQILLLVFSKFDAGVSCASSCLSCEVIPAMNHKQSRLANCLSGIRRSNAIRHSGLLIAGSALLVVSGCMNAQITRFPSWYTWFPGSENEAFERQDPFPDPDIGPSMYFTPRGYERPRSESRRAAEQRMFQGMPVGPENVRPGVPQGGLNTNRSVN